MQTSCYHARLPWETLRVLNHLVHPRRSPLSDFIPLLQRGESHARPELENVVDSKSFFEMRSMKSSRRAST